MSSSNIEDEIDSLITHREILQRKLSDLVDRGQRITRRNSGGDLYHKLIENISDVTNRIREVQRNLTPTRRVHFSVLQPTVIPNQILESGLTRDYSLTMPTNRTPPVSPINSTMLNPTTVGTSFTSTTTTSTIITTMPPITLATNQNPSNYRRTQGPMVQQSGMDGAYSLIPTNIFPNYIQPTTTNIISAPNAAYTAPSVNITSNQQTSSNAFFPENAAFSLPTPITHPGSASMNTQSNGNMNMSNQMNNTDGQEALLGLTQYLTDTVRKLQNDLTILHTRLATNETQVARFNNTISNVENSIASAIRRSSIPGTTQNQNVSMGNGDQNLQNRSFQANPFENRFLWGKIERIPLFDGQTLKSLNTFINTCDSVIRTIREYGNPQHEVGFYCEIDSKISDRVFHNTFGVQNIEWSVTRRNLLAHYAYLQRNTDVIIATIENLHQEKDEELTKYADRARKLLHELNSAYDPLTQQLRVDNDKRVARGFVRGLNGVEVKRQIPTGIITDLNNTITQVLNTEASTSLEVAPRDLFCQTCKSVGHRDSTCRIKNRNASEMLNSLLTTLTLRNGQSNNGGVNIQRNGGRRIIYGNNAYNQQNQNNTNNNGNNQTQNRNNYNTGNFNAQNQQNIPRNNINNNNRNNGANNLRVTNIDEQTDLVQQPIIYENEYENDMHLEEHNQYYPDQFPIMFDSEN